MDNPTRSEWCPVFCFQWWDQWPAQPRGDRQSNWRPGRNRCSYTMNMHLVGCLFTKSQGADFPFFWKQRKIQQRVTLSTCRPITAKNVAEAIRLLYILQKMNSYNRWASIYRHDNMLKVQCTNPVWGTSSLSGVLLCLFRYGAFFLFFIPN